MITILGPGQMFITVDGSVGMITTVLVGSTYVDAGATAIKVPANTMLPPINLTASIIVRGIEVISTAAPTPPSLPLIIAYDVQDNASPPNKAQTVRRRVQVICAPSEHICSNDDGSLSCSYGGICMGAAVTSIAGASKDPSISIAPIAVFPPSASIVPTLSLNGPSSITVSANFPYVPCVGLATSNCEMGATASVSTAGDFNIRIRACEDLAPASVKVPLPYKSVGLQYCGIDSTKPGTYTVVFSVSNDNSARVTVPRTVVVVPSCDSGEQACSDRTCGAPGGDHWANPENTRRGQRMTEGSGSC